MRDYERIEKVIRYLKSHSSDQPSLRELARVAGLSEFHFHRLFSRWAGVTPKDFLKFLTARHARELLSERRDVLSASLESGLSGPGRLHDLFVTVEAVTPGEFKSRGRGVEIRYGFHVTPFGDCLLATTPRGICHLSFLEISREQALRELRGFWVNAKLIRDTRATAELARAIFERSPKKGRVPLLLRGTPFQLKVWEALLRVPEGRLVSYSEVARAIGVPAARRAVGTAVASNSIGYLIPCHRVIRETGYFGQYRWGEARKRAIVAWEAARSRARLT